MSYPISLKHSQHFLRGPGTLRNETEVSNGRPNVHVGRLWEGPRHKMLGLGFTLLAGCFELVFFFSLFCIFRDVYGARF